MSASDWIGSLGVSLLLIAFFSNLFGFIGRETRTYMLINLGGGGMACLASFLIDFIPFVILEGTWAVVALVGLVRKEMGKT